MKVTLKQIAQVAEVSISTVSRVLSGQMENIQPATRQKVMAAMSVLGLSLEEIDSTEQFIRQKRKKANSSNIIYCLFRSRSVHMSPFWNNLILAVAMAAEKHKMGCQYLYGEEGVAFLRKHRVEKLIILGPQPNLEVFSVAKESAVSMVYVECTIKLPGAFSQCKLSIDYFSGGRDATEYLISLGHKRIGYIGGQNRWWKECENRENLLDAEGRLEGYRWALQNHGIPVNEGLIKNGDWEAKWGYQAFCQMMERREAPTAIFAASDFIAMGIISAANSMHLRIPEDVSIVSFDNIDYAQYSAPPLTTMNVDIGTIAQMSVVLLEEQYKEPLFFSNPFQSIFRPTLLVRESARPIINP